MVKSLLLLIYCWIMVKSRNMTSWRLLVWCFKHRGRWPKRNWEMKIPMIVFIRKHALLLVKSQIRGVTYSFWCLLLMPLLGAFWIWHLFQFYSHLFLAWDLASPQHRNPEKLLPCLTRHPNPVKQGLVLREPPLQKVGETSWQVPWLKAMVFMVVFLASHDSQIISQNPYIYIYIYI